MSAGPPLCSEHSLCSSSVLFSGSKVHSIHSLSIPSRTCTGWWAVWKKKKHWKREKYQQHPASDKGRNLLMWHLFLTPLPKVDQEKTSKPCGYEWQERGPYHPELSLDTYLILVEMKRTGSLLTTAWELPPATGLQSCHGLPNSLTLTIHSALGDHHQELCRYHYSQGLLYITKPSKTVRSIITYYKSTHPQLSSGTGHLWR